MNNLLDNLRKNLGLHTNSDIVIEVVLLALWMIPLLRKFFTRDRH